MLKFVYCSVTDTGKADIVDFQQKYPFIRHSYKKIYIKVFNEQKTVRLRANKRSQEMGE